MTWTSKELKKKGLERLDGHFAKAYAAVFLCRLSADVPVYFLGERRYAEGMAAPETALALVSIAIIVLLLAVLNVGKNRFFLELREEKAEIGNLWRYFSEGKDRCFSVIKGMLLRYANVLAGMLIFIIPGIMGYYSTFFVPWILAEHPEISAGRVLRMSRDMTKGQRINIFIMQMTFAGWAILSAFLSYRFSRVLPLTLARIVSTGIYTLPLVYYQAAAAELYVKLSDALDMFQKNEK